MDRPDSLAMAASFATTVQFLYEWEGMADSPLAEEAEAQLSAARNSGDPLLRVVADYLLSTRRCYER
jgi:hypothetical protein